MNRERNQAWILDVDVLRYILRSLLLAFITTGSVAGDVHSKQPY
jgi:hypothetical protein